MFGDKKVKIKDSERSLISETMSIEGTINSSGAIDVAGLIKGPVFSKEVVIKENGAVISRSNERTVATPDMDINSLDSEVADIAKTVWTDEVKTKHKEAVDSLS